MPIDKDSAERMNRDMKKIGDKLDLRQFVDLRPIVEDARSRGEHHIKLPCSKYLLEGDLRYLQGVIVEMLPSSGAR
jgi:hypothetical protein